MGFKAVDGGFLFILLKFMILCHLGLATLAVGIMNPGEQDKGNIHPHKYG